MYPISQPSLKDLSINLFNSSKPLNFLKGDSKITFQNYNFLNNDESVKLSMGLYDSKLSNEQTEFKKPFFESFSSSITESRKRSDIVIEKEYEPKNRIIVYNDDLTDELKLFQRKYKFQTSLNNIIRIPGYYSTDDDDEYNLISLINEPFDFNWKLEIDDKINIIKIYKKEKIKNEILLLKIFAEIPFSLRIIMKVLNDYNFRLEWDQINQKLFIIEKIQNYDNEFESFIQYSYMKFPAFMQDRDFVQICKLWNYYLGNPKLVLCHYKSTTHMKYPPLSDVIRAEMIIGGYFLEEINNNLTKCSFVLNSDFKLSNNISLINKNIVENQHNFIINLINGCKLWIKRKKNKI